MKAEFVGILLLVLLIGGCVENQEDNIILQIGQYELREADYELVKSSPKYNGLSTSQLKEKLIEEGRIIAFALENRYDTVSALEKQLEYAMRFYVSEVDGYLWNKRVKPKLHIPENEIRDAYEKRDKKYHFDVIKFPDEKALQRFLLAPDVAILKSDFFSLKNKVASEDDIKSYSYSSLYPFYPFGAYIDELVSADVGDTFGPFQTQDGFFILHITRISPEQQRPYDYLKGAISQELSFVLKEEYIWESQQEIYSHTNPQISDEAIKELTSKVNVEKREWSGVDTNMVVMNYHLNGEDRNFTINEFIEFTHYQPVFFGLLSNPEDVKKMIKSYLIGVYLFAEAQKINAESDEEYLLSKRSLQNKIFVSAFKQKHIYPYLTVQSNEIAQYYADQIEKYDGFSSAAISVYRFPDFDKAFQGQRLISNQFIDSTRDQGVNSVTMKSNLLPEPELTTFKVEEQEYDKNIITAISNMKVGELSTPLKVGEEFWVIQLHDKKGSAPLPLLYVKEDIKQMLVSTKEKNLLDSLTRKYAVKVDDLNQYLRQKKKTRPFEQPS